MVCLCWCGIFRHVGLQVFGSQSHSIMDGLKNLWSCFTLDDEEEYGVEVPNRWRRQCTSWLADFS